MRYSDDEPQTLRTPIKASESNRKFFEAIPNKNDLRGAVLLVGGRDVVSRSVRQAQSVLRFDRLPSYWSHAALVLEWTGERALGIGVEVVLGPKSGQRPERNGVTPFSLSDYASNEEWPNLALLVPKLKADTSAASRKSIVDRALDPNRERLRYPFWDTIGLWLRYAYAPTSAPSPLSIPVSHPSAALCEFAYSAANIDLSPGATADNTCPEVLWATALRWGTRMKEYQGSIFESYAVIRDEAMVPPKPLPPLKEDPTFEKLASTRSSKAVRVVSSARRRRSKAARA